MCKFQRHIGVLGMKRKPKFQLRLRTRRLDQFHSSTESSNIYVIQLSVSTLALEIFVRYLWLQLNSSALIILQGTMTIARCLVLFPLSSCRLSTVDGTFKSMTNQPADLFETRLFAQAFAPGVARILTGYTSH